MFGRREVTTLSIFFTVLFHPSWSGRPADLDEISEELPARIRRKGGSSPESIERVNSDSLSCDLSGKVRAICHCWNSTAEVSCVVVKNPCSETHGNSTMKQDFEGFNCSCDSCGSIVASCDIDYFPKPHKYCTNVTTLSTARPPNRTATTTAPVKYSSTRTTTTRSTTTARDESTTNIPDQALAEMLLNMSQHPDKIGESELQDIIDGLVELEERRSSDQTVTTNFIIVINNVMVVDPRTLSNVRDVALLPRLLGKQLGYLHRNRVNYTTVQENVACSVNDVDPSSFDGYVGYEDPLNETRSGMTMAASTSITLPRSTLDTIQRVIPNVTDVPLTFTVYRETKIFQTSSNESGRIVSRAISASVDIDGIEINNLTEPVIVEFQYQFDKSSLEEQGELVCVFWDYSPESQTGQWSTAGCNITLRDDKVICHCNHLTSFAVLVRGTSGRSPGISASFEEALSIITLIGCYISIGCLVACLLLMVLVKSVREKQETSIHINLCVSLLGLYLTFAIGIERTGNPDNCEVIAAIIHLFCLASVAWMSVEAFIVYKLIYKYERAETKYLTPFAMTFAWGIAAVASVLVYLIEDFPTQPDFCFLHQGVGFYFGFLLPAFFLTIYNSVVFTLATYRMQCRPINAVDKKASRKEISQRVFSTALFWVLLGVSWLFGFLSAFQNPTSVVFQLLFCVFLTLHGLFMFYFIFIQSPILKEKVGSMIKSSSNSLRFFARHSSRNNVPLNVIEPAKAEISSGQADSTC